MVYRTFVLVFGIAFLAGLPTGCKVEPDQSRGKMTGIIVAPPECAGQQLTVKLIDDDDGSDAGSQVVTLSTTGTGSYHLAPDPQPAKYGNYRAIAALPLACGATTVDSPSAAHRLYKADPDVVQHNFAFVLP